MVEQLTLNQRVAGSSPARFTTNQCLCEYLHHGVFGQEVILHSSIEDPLLAGLGGFSLFILLTAAEIAAALLHLVHRIQQLLWGNDVVPVKHRAGLVTTNAHGNPFLHTAVR